MPSCSGEAGDSRYPQCAALSDLRKPTQEDDECQTLELAPHHYSDEMKRPHPLAAPRALREAERLMREADGVASVREIAAAVAVSVRSLEAGFRQWKHETPVAFMRRLRLASARERLSNPVARTTVTEVALSCGFLHLSRFAQYYRAAFNEHPSETLRNARRGRRGLNSRGPTSE